VATETGSSANSWNHILIRNSGSECEMFIDGVGQSSGSLPQHSTANAADIIIGSFTSSYNTNLGALNNDRIAELRIYDYAVNSTALNSLSNRDYISGSLFQTNVAGNIFYRNGQLVVSSPLTKYNSGSGLFAEASTTSWKGTHTIYENQVLVRVPRGSFNTTINPSATYSPVTDKPLTEAQQAGRLPGNRYKAIFESGSAFPYITSIGLYNDQYQLLAVAKLAQPIQKRNDIDMNFLIRWDY